MAFISIDKMKQLREQAKNGDERAKKILQMQMNNQDFSSLLEEHFKPIQEKPALNDTNTDNVAQKQDFSKELQDFLDFNEVKEGDPEYNDTIEAFYQENPHLRPNKNEGDIVPVEQNQNVEEQKGLLDDLSDKIKDLLSACDQAIMNVADDNENDITGATLKGTLSTLQEVKQSALDAFEKIKDLKGSIAKKQESDIM